MVLSDRRWPRRTWSRDADSPHALLGQRLTLHLFPAGHLLPEEEAVTLRTHGALTVCGHAVLLNWHSSRSWVRAGRGEWLEHYQALTRFRAHRWRREASGESVNDRWVDGYEMARRICGACAEYHGLFLECLEAPGGAERWPAWTLIEIRQRAAQELTDKLKGRRPTAPLQVDRTRAAKAWISAELDIAARAAKRRGPGPLQQLYGYRDDAGRSTYERWAERCQRAGSEPHELISEADWRRLLADELAALQHTGAAGQRAGGGLRQALSELVEAGMPAPAQRGRPRAR